MTGFRNGIEVIIKPLDTHILCADFTASKHGKISSATKMHPLIVIQ